MVARRVSVNASTASTTSEKRNEWNKWEPGVN
jgi:hypothetical protein